MRDEGGGRREKGEGRRDEGPLLLALCLGLKVDALKPLVGGCLKTSFLL